MDSRIILMMNKLEVNFENQVLEFLNQLLEHSPSSMWGSKDPFGKCFYDWMPAQAGGKNHIKTDLK